MRTAVIGGGAAGFFLAINLKTLRPEMTVTIFEASHRVLRKVEISGGGRCNCTNSFASVSDLSQVYPRGHRLLKRLFRQFGPTDAFRWFEERGVPLVTQDDDCVFPAAQDSHAIINCFLHEARKLGVEILTDRRIHSLDELADYDCVAVTTGGSARAEGLQWLAEKGIETVPPVPSLFTLCIDDEQLQRLMGTVAETATVQIPATRFEASGPLLITHWGMSGPAILRLSSHAARHLADNDYHAPLSVNWLSRPAQDILHELERLATQNPQKQLSSVRPFDLPTRLWQYLTEKTLGEKAQCRWGEIGKKNMNRLLNTLYNDQYQTAGRAPFKDEFVTCGGVSLKAVDATTLESKAVPRLFFAGEILDIDGVTGGFNFQAAWTTAYCVAQAIANIN